MRNSKTLLLVLVSLLAFACASGGGSEKAARAAEVADAIAAEPARAEEILAERGMTVEEFETLLSEIAEDPALTKEYEGLRKVPDPR